MPNIHIDELCQTFQWRWCIYTIRRLLGRVLVFLLTKIGIVVLLGAKIKT